MSACRIWLAFPFAPGSRTSDNLRLLATELSVNAMKHTISGRWRRGSFRVRMWLSDRQVRVEVLDQGWWSGPRLRNDPTETSGRGLRIVEATATRWGVRRKGLGRTVWFELPIPSDVPVAGSVKSGSGPSR
ncbi:ATP-binding protein [Nonomuraea cypriaca]|uniref:ATP-binding protein n=1 Tax=Nonomuraea cypriaca TaxID=1187855 RepID=UPI0038B22EA8